jgi:hypothetical protein
MAHAAITKAIKRTSRIGSIFLVRTLILNYTC